MHEFSVGLHIPRMAFDILFVISLRMISVHKEIRVIPVKKGEINPDLQTFCAKCIDIFPDKVAAKLCVRDLVIGELRVPQREPFMVFHCQDCILKSRFFCHFCPFPGVKQIRVEIIKVFSVSFFSDLLKCHYPFMSCRCRKQTKMDKQTEPVMDKPVRISVILRPLINVFTFHPLFSFRFCLLCITTILDYSFFIF